MPKRNNAGDPPAPIISETESYSFPEQYTPDEVNDYISAQYPGQDIVYTHIKLHRVPETGPSLFLARYDYLPEEQDILKVYGGGHYKLYIQWKPKEGSWTDRKFRTVDLFLAGDPKPIESAAAISSPGAPAISEEDAEYKFLKKMQLYKELFGGQPAGAAGPSDSVMSAAIKANTELLTKVMDQPKPVENPLINEFLQMAIKAGLEKSNVSEIDTYLKYKNVFDKNNGPIEDDLPTQINKWMPIIKQAGPIIKAITNPGANMLPGAPVNGSQALLEAPGATIPAPGNIEAGLERLAQIMDQNFQAMQAENAAIKKKLADLENELGTVDTDPENPEQPKEISEKEKEDNMSLGKMLSLLPDEAKAEQLNNYLKDNSVKDVYEWCIAYKAIPSLEEFNRIMKIAGQPEYIPETAAK